MRIIKKYRKVIVDLIGEHNISNLRVEDSVDGESNIMFETTTQDGKEKTCSLLIDLKVNSTKEVSKYIKEDFYNEFSRLTYDGTLESELEEIDYQEDCHMYNNEGCDCCDGQCDDYENDTDRVAAGLGFYIDEDNNWVPDDNDYYDDWSEDLEPDCCYKVLNDGSIEFTDEYSSFKFTYKDEEEAKEYIK